MKRILSLMLCCALLCGLFTGCNQPYVPSGSGLSTGDPNSGSTSKPEQTEQALTLTYYPDRSLNPFSCTDFTNRALFPLLYQSLFTVDRDYRVEPMLCKNYSISQDMKTYTFYIEENVTFPDGSILTGEDVVASLSEAMLHDFYSGRFLHVTYIGLAEDGGITVRLNTPCEDLPILLDIPIVPASQVQADIPLGTGPYYFDQTALNTCLRRRTGWWCKATMAVTASTIALTKAESINQIRDEFQFSDLSLVCADPGSDRYADYRCDYELWDCETGIFLYLACSESSPIFADPEMRAALTYAIDRDYLAETFYRGFARSATLPASPQFPYYSQTLAAKYKYDGETLNRVIREKGFLNEEITFLVNSDDSLRVRVARAIGKMLTDAGFVVKMKEVGTAAYKEALIYRSFDIYLGQTVLSPNMDLSAFLAGNGKLSYGGVDDVTAYFLSQQALENYGNYYTLHQTVMDQGIFTPVLLRSYAVYATRGVLSGLTPARNNIFYYSIGKTMEQALIRT